MKESLISVPLWVLVNICNRTPCFPLLAGHLVCIKRRSELVCYGYNGSCHRCVHSPDVQSCYPFSQRRALPQTAKDKSLCNSHSKPALQSVKRCDRKHDVVVCVFFARWSPRPSSTFSQSSFHSLSHFPPYTPTIYPLTISLWTTLHVWTVMSSDTGQWNIA